MAKRLIWMSPLLLLLGWTSATRADEFTAATKRVPMRFTSHLDAQIPLDINFVNEEGNPVQLKDLFQHRPVILNLVYFNCPQMCTEVLNGLVQSMKKMKLNLSKDYDVLTLSIDEREKPPLAKAKKKLYVDRYGRPGSEAGWSFLTGDSTSIKALADAVGFQYKYYSDIDQFDHALGIVVLTPEGKVAQYFYGVRYDPRKLGSALREASK